MDNVRKVRDREPSNKMKIFRVTVTIASYVKAEDEQSAIELALVSGEFMISGNVIAVEVEDT